MGLRVGELFRMTGGNMNFIERQLEKLRNWITGAARVPIKIKEEKRGNGGNQQAEKIRRFWK